MVLRLVLWLGEGEGVSRLTISLTVIMMEITNDIRFLLPIMTAILIAKRVADTLTHSLYHALLEMKCIPFIGSDPPPSQESLDLHPVSKIMTTPVVTLPLSGPASAYAEVLSSCPANAFPVVKRGETGRDVFLGMILRKHMLRVLVNPNETEFSHLEDVSDGYMHELPPAMESQILREHAGSTGHIDLAAFYDDGALSVSAHFSVSRAFVTFRALGLRHVTVVDEHNTPVGIITRKELLGMHIEQCLHHSEGDHGDGHSVPNPVAVTNSDL